MIDNKITIADGVKLEVIKLEEETTKEKVDKGEWNTITMLN